MAKTYSLYLNKCPISTKENLKELDKIIDLDSWKQTKELIENNSCHCQVECGYNVDNAIFNAKGVSQTICGNLIQGKTYQCRIEVCNDREFAERFAEILEKYFKSKDMLIDKVEGRK